MPVYIIYHEYFTCYGQGTLGTYMMCNESKIRWHSCALLLNIDETLTYNNIFN